MAKNKAADKKKTATKSKNAPRKPRVKKETVANKPKAAEETISQDKPVHRSDRGAAPAPAAIPGGVHRSDSSFNTANVQAPAAAAPQPSQPAEDKQEPLTTFTPVTPPDTHRAG